jgi:glycosyltransferase involved in cell wall biosynthesis
LRNNLKIALVSPEFPPNSIGGISAVCYGLAMSLSERAHVSTTVFCGASEKVPVEQVNDYLTVVRMPQMNLPPRHLWFQVKNLSALLPLLKEFDVVHGLNTHGGFLAYFGKNLHKPLITHVHDCDHCSTNVFLRSSPAFWSVGDLVYYGLEYPMNEFLTNMSFHNSTHLVVCSNVRFTEMVRRSKVDSSKISVIYNGIDFNKIKDVGVIEEQAHSIVFWGRLYFVKGIIQLVKALALVKEEYPDVTLDICGKGPLAANIRLLIDKLKLNDNVRIHGYVSDEFLTNKIRSASVVALPSLYEAQPMAMLEAMSYKKCVVAYDYPFVREYITDWQNGLCAKAGDVKDLAKRICIALSDKDLRNRIGQNAYATVRRNHNWDTLINKYVGLYQNLANKS